jgi:hypothetical protein
MKKLIIILTIVLAQFSARACDICGCGVGNNYIGILPDFSKHIFGLRMRTNSMLTHVGVGGSSSYLTTLENYRTLEAWAGWNISDNFRLIASLPYSFNEKLNQGTVRRKSGLGDASLLAYYQLINNKKSLNSKLLVQSLWVGGGLKLPTGKYNPLDKSSANTTANLFQLGTGSIDFSANAMYDIRLNDAGLNASAAYKINTTNKEDYRYGNKLSLMAQAYYKFRILNAFTVAPNLGMGYEKGRPDSDRGLTADISGGQLTMGTAGAELTWKSISAGFNYQTPLQQNLAMGIVKARDRAMVHVSFML